MEINQKNIFGQNNYFQANKVIWKARGEGIIVGIVLSAAGSFIWELIKSILWK